MISKCSIILFCFCVYVWFFSSSLCYENMGVPSLQKYFNLYNLLLEFKCAIVVNYTIIAVTIRVIA